VNDIEPFRISDELQEMRKRLDDVLHMVHASYHENLFWLRRIHHSSSIFLGDNTALTFLDNGCRAYIDTRSRDVGVHLLHGGSWEANYTEAFKRMIRPGCVVLDVGANLGWYSLVAAPIVGASGRVLAVEANPDLARLVHASLATNGFGDHARVFSVAVGETHGTVDLVTSPAMSGGGYIQRSRFDLTIEATPTVRVAVVPLDDLLADEPRAIDVMKMDIEGSEGFAIRGMTKLLDRSPDLRILIEWGPAQDATKAPRAETAHTLARRGYVPLHIGEGGETTLATWDAVLAEQTLTNLILVKEDDPLSPG